VQIGAARRLAPIQVARYGLTAGELDAMKERMARWAAQVRHASGQA
jgi:hypothetical protein